MHSPVYSTPILGCPGDISNSHVCHSWWQLYPSSCPRQKDLESSLLFLSHSDIIRKFCSTAFRRYSESDHFLSLQCEPLSSVTCMIRRPHIWSPLFFHCLLISFSAQERSSSETQVRACPLSAQTMQCSGPLFHYMPSPSLVHHSHHPGSSTGHAQSYHGAFAPAAPSA